jgi:hypothetical protein
MHKEMPVIPVNRVVDKKRITRKREGRGGGDAQVSLTPKNPKYFKISVKIRICNVLHWL